MSMHNLNFLGIVAIACVGISCSSTKVLSFSNSKHEARQQIDSVVTVMVDDRAYLRAAVENHMAGRCRELGAEAYPSHTRISLNVLETDKEKAREELAGWGTDAVLVSKLVDRTEISKPPQFVSSETHWEQAWAAPSASTEFDPSPWGGEVVVKVNLESKLYHGTTSDLLWVGYTETEMTEFTDDMKFIRAVSRKVVDQIAEDGWFK